MHGAQARAPSKVVVNQKRNDFCLKKSASRARELHFHFSTKTDIFRLGKGPSTRNVETSHARAPKMEVGRDRKWVVFGGPFCSDERLAQTRVRFQTKSERIARDIPKKTTAIVKQAGGQK